MDITITCKSYEELTQLAKTLIGGAGQARPEPPVQGGAPAASMTPGVSVAPTAQTAPQILPAQNTVPVASQTPPMVPALPTAPQTPPVAPTQNAAVPTSTASYTQDDLAKAAITLMDSGRQAELQQLLQGFGVAYLPELPAARYGEFATALRTMGAPI